MSLSWDLARMSKDKMFINGVCSDTVGLYVDLPPMPPMAEESVIQYNVPGRSGTLYRRTGTYQDITLTVRCFVFDGGYHPGQIYRYISSAKTLTFTKTYDYFYEVKQVLGITPQYQIAGKNFLNIQFVCSPFRYRRQNIAEELREKSTLCDNIGNVYCEPVYRLNVQGGEAKFTVNDTELLLNDLTGEVVIDLPRRKIYQESGGDLSIVQNQTSGKFWNMVLEPGYNSLDWTDNITNVLVTKNERWI